MTSRNIPSLPVHLDALSRAIQEKTGTTLSRHDILDIASKALGYNNPRGLSSVCKNHSLATAGEAHNNAPSYTLHDPYADADFSVNADWLDAHIAQSPKAPVIRSPYGHFIRVPTPLPSTSSHTNNTSNIIPTGNIVYLLQNETIGVEARSILFNPPPFIQNRIDNIQHPEDIIAKNKHAWLASAPATLWSGHPAATMYNTTSPIPVLTIMEYSKKHPHADLLHPVIVTVENGLTDESINFDASGILHQLEQDVLERIVAGPSHSAASDLVGQDPYIVAHYTMQRLYQLLNQNNLTGNEAWYSINIDYTGLICWLLAHRPETLATCAMNGELSEHTHEYIDAINFDDENPYNNPHNPCFALVVYPDEKPIIVGVNINAYTHRQPHDIATGDIFHEGNRLLSYMDTYQQKRAKSVTPYIIRAPK